MSVEVKRAGGLIVLEFADAEIVDCYGSRDEQYGDGSVVLSRDEALRLAKEILERLMEMDEDQEGEGHEEET